MRVALGADHAGITLKDRVKRAFDDADGDGIDDSLSYVDFGTNSEDAVDYPDYARRVAEGVACGDFDRGILICGSGIGMSIAANKVRGVRAALVSDIDGARLSREHNDANVLALAGRTLAPDTAVAIITTFLATSFAGGRHQLRLDKIASIEHQSEGTP